MAALSPCDSFSGFDKAKLLKLSEIYKNDFDDSERVQLNGQLDIYYHSLLHDERFFNLKGIADLSRLLVETGKHLSFPLVYRLLKLTLVLPVATATVEQCFSAMKFLKTDLRNRIVWNAGTNRNKKKRKRKLGLAASSCCCHPPSPAAASPPSDGGWLRLLHHRRRLQGFDSDS
ncbi:uncharacterized protein LOC128127191 [Lactuca sativa]|uniref:uncharacterized protein LOC128127191 n=1 Tax=Lactuca sativa TaxID=4236 RepID=UPI0022AE74FD|nr:uncharacterized protein LOC128127191 [Lactuca sativa]